MKSKLASLLLVLCLGATVRAETIIQSISTPPGGASSLTLPNPPQPGNFLRVSTLQKGVLGVLGVAANWSYPNAYSAIGAGPFTPNAAGLYIVRLTMGRMPPKINATLEEVAP